MIIKLELRDEESLKELLNGIVLDPKRSKAKVSLKKGPEDSYHLIMSMDVEDRPKLKEWIDG